ncbi:MAG: hypothetical protein IPJ01_11380 [Micavibrio sp.]|nr:hypothetical protein [Micavibrio sp.]
MDKENEMFIMECPVCKMKHELPMIKRGFSTQFACSDDRNTDGVGCKSVITVNVAVRGYNETM